MPMTRTTDQLMALAYKPDQLRSAGWTRTDDLAAQAELLERARTTAVTLEARLAAGGTNTTMQLACTIADIIRAARLIELRLAGLVAGFRYHDDPGLPSWMARPAVAVATD